MSDLVLCLVILFYPLLVFALARRRLLSHDDPGQD